MFMSMSVGPFCDLAQDVDSKDWTQGAVVSLVMDENERECEYLIQFPKELSLCNNFWLFSFFFFYIFAIQCRRP